MPGINDNIVFPIIDLIRSEIRRYLRENGFNISNSNQNLFNNDQDPFGGIPSVNLIRNHPQDSSKTIVTGVNLVYDSGFIIEIVLFYGVNNNPFLLNSVQVYISGLNGETYTFTLNRDERGLLTSTTVTKIG